MDACYWYNCFFYLPIRLQLTTYRQHLGDAVHSQADLTIASSAFLDFLSAVLGTSIPGFL